jgi:hypothetical protein
MAKIVNLSAAKYLRQANVAAGAKDLWLTTGAISRYDGIGWNRAQKVDCACQIIALQCNPRDFVEGFHSWWNCACEAVVMYIKEFQRRQVGQTFR